MEDGDVNLTWINIKCLDILLLGQIWVTTIKSHNNKLYLTYKNDVHTRVSFGLARSMIIPKYGLLFPSWLNWSFDRKKGKKKKKSNAFHHLSFYTTALDLCLQALFLCLKHRFEFLFPSLLTFHLHLFHWWEILHAVNIREGGFFFLEGVK